MLEGAGVVLHIVVVIVGIGEEVFVHRKDIGTRDIGRRESEFTGIAYFEHLLGVVTQVLATLIAEVGIGVAIAYHLDGIVDTDSAMVGGDYHFVTQFGEATEDVESRRVTEPGFGDRPISGIVACQFADHLRFGAGMREHIDEVDHHDLEGKIAGGVESLQEFLACRG